MAKYEIMLVVAGSLNEDEAKKVSNELLKTLGSTKIKTVEYGSKQLAYQIKKNTHGYYFQYNFETDEVPLVNEFRRLTLLNKNVLRHMIINLEKDYGYKAISNPKKVQKSEKKSEIYKVRKAEQDKIREARIAERNARYEARKNFENSKKANNEFKKEEKKSQ